jgi:glycosyltransferase involved in cell wall biosynthesis
MKILFVTQCVLTRQLGGARVAMEIAAAMRPLGWEAELVGMPDLAAEHRRSHGPRIADCDALRDFMHRRGGDYDVVDFDHAYLPFPRGEFSTRTLLVARSVLLLEHLTRIKIPMPPAFELRNLVRKILTADRLRRNQARTIDQARRTVLQADLVNVPNDDDRECLEQMGVPAEKIVVLPYGVWPETWMNHRVENGRAAPEPTMVFVGTFDFRKGCVDLVEIARIVFSQIPGSRLKLLGTAGAFQTKDEVLSFFPRGHRNRVEIVPRFEPEDLPALLRGAAIGIFPSYLEGFGMAVVEMVAAGLPVLAYRVPGPASILPTDCLVAPGRADLLAQKVLALLRDPARLQQRAEECRKQCAPFNWPEIGRKTSEIYRIAVARLRTS